MGRKLILFLITALFSVILWSCSETILDEVKDKIVQDQIAAGIDPFPDAPLVTASFATPASDVTNLNPIALVITFSEEVSALAIHQLTLTNCTTSEIRTADSTVFTLTLEPVSDGKVQLIIPADTVASVATYKSNLESIFELYYDSTAPEMPVVTGATPTPNLRPTWSWSSSGEEGAIFRYKLGDSDFSNGATQTAETSFTPAADLAETEWRLYVQEGDAAGNWSPTGSFAIVINVQVPQAPVFNTVSTARYTTNLTPVWYWSSGGNGGSGTYRFKINDEDLSTDASSITATSYTLSPAAPDDTTVDYTLYIQESSSAGVWGEPSSFTITIDNESPPTPGIILPADNHGADDGIYRTSIDVSVDSETIEPEAVVEYRWRQNSGTWSAYQSYSTSVTFNGVVDSDIDYDIEITQTDQAGNTSSNSTGFSIDRAIPAAPSITGITAGTQGTDDSFTLGYESGATAYYSTDNGSSYTEYPGSGVDLTVESGSITTYYVKAYQIDIAGNESDETSTISLTIDKQPPNSPDVGTSGTTSTPTEDTTPTWYWQSGGNGGSGYYLYNLNNSSRPAGSGSSITSYTAGTLAEGSYTLYVWERDAYYNWSDAGEYTIVVDLLPSGSFTINGGAVSTTSRDISINSSVTNATQMRFKNSEDSDYEDWITYNGTYSFTFTGVDESNTINGQYRDAEGNVVTLNSSITYSPEWDDVTIPDIAQWTRNLTTITDARWIFPAGAGHLDLGDAFLIVQSNPEGNPISTRKTYYYKFRITSLTAASTYATYTIAIESWEDSLLGGETKRSDDTASFTVNNEDSKFLNLYNGSVSDSYNTFSVYVQVEFYYNYNSTSNFKTLRTTTTNNLPFGTWTPAD